MGLPETSKTEKIVNYAELQAELKKEMPKISFPRRMLNKTLKFICLPALVPMKVVRGIKEIGTKPKQNELRDVYVTPDFVSRLKKNPLAIGDLLKESYFSADRFKETLLEKNPLKLERLIDKFSGVAKKRAGLDAAIDRAFQSAPDHSAKVASGYLVRLDRVI